MTKEQDIKNAVEAMRKGGVILYPTDTVWGIGCDATNAEAVARVYFCASARGIDDADDHQDEEEKSDNAEKDTHYRTRNGNMIKDRSDYRRRHAVKDIGNEKHDALIQMEA